MPTSVRLSPSVEIRLAGLAKRTGRAQAFYLREFVERGLEDLEDYYLAAYESELLRQGKAQAVPLNEMRQRLGLEGRKIG